MHRRLNLGQRILRALLVAIRKLLGEGGFQAVDLVGAGRLLAALGPARLQLLQRGQRSLQVTAADLLLELLSQRGSDLVQGYWLGRPLDAPGLVGLLEQGAMAALR